MLRSTFRWTLILGSLLAVGPLAFHFTSALRDADGGHAVSLLVGDGAGPGLLAGAVTFGAATVVGLLGVYLFSLGTGCVCAGLVLCWGAWGLGTIGDIVRRTRSGQDLTMVGVEGLVVTLLTLVLACVLVWVAVRRQPPLAPGKVVHRPRGWLALFAVDVDPDAQPMAALGLGFGAALIVGGLAVWLVAVTSLRGQTLMAALLGALAAASVAQLAASSCRVTLTPLIPILAVGVLALCGPISATVIHGKGVVEAVFSEQLFALARPVSLDWAGGALLGVPIGLSWAGAMLDVRAAADD